jgi:hypothetical protein
MSITITEIAANSTHLSGNIIKVVATTSGIPVNATDYKILLKIVSIDNLLIGSPFIDGKTPDVNNRCEFDISGYIDQHAEKDFAWPVPGVFDGKWQGYEDQVYEVQLVAGESYINSSGALVETFQSAFGTVFAVKGKLNPLVQSRLNDASATWFSYYISGGKWLTYMPATQYVGPHQPVKLWWKPPTTGLTFAFKVKAYYTDGSTDTYTGSPTMYYNVMFEFDCHPAGLGFTLSNSTKRLQYYEVWMEGTPNVEKRTFIIDWRPVENNYYLFADNQQGGIDCIWLNGAVTYSPESEKIITQKPYVSGMGTKQRTRYVGSSRRTRTWTLSSGYRFTAEEIDALDVLLDTTFAWLAVPPSAGATNIAQYKLVPVIVGNTGFELSNSMADLYAVQIKLEEAL